MRKEGKEEREERKYREKIGWPFFLFISNGRMYYFTAF
jgi:hypothetical protein